MPPKADYERLASLLYKKTVPEVKPKLPIMKRVLYEPELNPNASRKSVLEDLMEFEWDQKPMALAMADMVQRNGKIEKSNILRLDCRNKYVGRSDLRDIFPVMRERRYIMPAKQKDLDFNVVKSRNPFSLLFTGAYYLIFQNFNQACVYYLETAAKALNGIAVNLTFVQPTENNLRKMCSPLLTSNDVLPQMIESGQKSFGSIPISEIFAGSPVANELLSNLLHSPKDRSGYHDSMVDPVYTWASRLAGIPGRYNQVLVQNLPFGITGPALENLLWDYEFENEEDPQKSILNFYTNSSLQTTLALLRFKDEDNARRFVRNYHGRRWEKMLSRKEKPLYAPILCEIVD